jgi:serine/threonine-protein phosphatase 2A catalytic subunit
MNNHVNRGSQSVETVSYLFCLKIKYSEHITLLRGNHESAGISQHFGFRDDVVTRESDDKIWQTYTHTCNSFPLAALIARTKVDIQILCVHGGLSPRIEKIADIKAIDRFRWPLE